jgi:hypothetical protein
MPTVDPDPAGLGTYLVAAVLLAWGIAIFLHILIREARASRGQEQDGREASLKLELRRGASRARSLAEIAFRAPNTVSRATE